MPATRFDGAADKIVATWGAVDTTGPMTVLIVRRRAATGTWSAMFVGETPTETTSWAAFEDNDLDALSVANSSTASFGTTAGTGVATTTGWFGSAYTKTTGTVNPNVYRRDLTANTALVTEGAAPTIDTDAVAAEVLKFGQWQSTDDYNGWIAVAAIWNQVLTTAQITECLANRRTSDIWNCSAGRPAALWEFNKSTITDLTGGGANETGRVGATLDNTEVPPWTYDGKGVTGDLPRRLPRFNPRTRPRLRNNPLFFAPVPRFSQIDTSVLTRVSDTRAITYDVQAAVSSSRALTYDIRNAVSASRAITYDVRAAVSATRAITYDVRSAIAATRAITYDIAGKTSSQRDITYDIRNLATSTRAITYDIRNLVTATRVLTYDIKAAVSSSRDIRYDIQAKASSSRDIRYDIRTLAGTTRAIAYDIRTAVNSTRAITYDIRTGVNSTRAITYNIDSTGDPPPTTGTPLIWKRRKRHYP